jgi:hypothetical protein
MRARGIRSLVLVGGPLAYAEQLGTFSKLFPDVCNRLCMSEVRTVGEMLFDLHLHGTEPELLSMRLCLFQSSSLKDTDWKASDIVDWRVSLEDFYRQHGLVAHPGQLWKHGLRR